VAALSGLVRQGVRFGNEQFESDAHLHDVVVKPWGEEYRAYADDFLDVWHLKLRPGHATSVHAHARKVTYLLCLSGEGTTSGLTTEFPLVAGAVIRIGRGAFHGTQNVGSVPLELIEVETPRNKLDLLRLRDGYDRAGKGYEPPSRSEPNRLDHTVPFVPNSHLCSRSPDGNYSFEVRAGMDIFYRRRAHDVFHIPLGIGDLIHNEINILDAEKSGERPEVDRYYLSLSACA
jgi:mannose-6-phosphate isomerase-like protein (cupin superfamily)